MEQTSKISKVKLDLVITELSCRLENRDFYLEVMQLKLNTNWRNRTSEVMNPLSANPKNGQTHSNNSSAIAIADELFECV